MWLRKPRFSVSLLAVLSVMPVTGCNVFEESWEWNQKLTVEVLVDGRVVSGSAVSFVHWDEPNALGNYGTDYRGEATVVDLGERGMLFALIGEGTKYIARDTLRNELGERLYEKLFPKIEQFRGTREVPRDNYPLLVKFDNIKDPATIKRVDPENLAASFGPDVLLNRITLTITDEPATEGTLEKLLPWWSAFYNRQLDGNRYRSANSKHEFANSLNLLNFARD
ncbi:MAG: hypothetical protein KDA51_00895 [Planctomycetales bacterium]|nr:hypothetical protein [Planctomycetales bacterium]